MRAVFAALFVTLAAAGPFNADGPFGDGEQDQPVELSYDQFARDIRDAQDRNYYVGIMITTEERRECPGCPYAKKQFEDFVASYKQQYRLGRIYHEEGPLHLVNVVRSHANAGILRELRIKHLPAFVVVKPGSMKPVYYGSAAIEDRQFKEIKKQIKAEVDEKKLATKGMQAQQHALRRRERRKKQLQTQEEQEYDSYGILSPHNDFSMVTWCKWLRVKSGMHMHECPQDVPRDFEQKKKPQDFLKNVLIMIVLASGAIWMGRIFGLGSLVELFDVNKVELRRLVHLKNSVQSGDEHQMVDLRPDWEIYGTLLIYGMALMVYCLLTGGMYWNILNNVPWSGRTMVAQGSRSQYGSESALLAILSATGTVAMLVATYSVTPTFLDFAKKKSSAFFVDDEKRALFKSAASIGGLAVWVIMFLFIFKIFLSKNQSYLGGTVVGFYIRFFLGELYR
eukprot:TRINITY_DN2198_c2_g1_i1.p1 TRINITY_DN2198_c2_g1~~TRINITY_DN2198_c2_g1_i1.p1  ORF type:complete len:452 (+),score=81.80 TRINITY_DN2198_c2_g1_i1:56-1411(+)